MAVPERRDGAFLPVAGEELLHGGGDGVRIGAKKFIGPHGYSLRPLCAVAKGHARYAHNSGFLGDASGVGNHCQASLNQVIEFKIPERFCQED